MRKVALVTGASRGIGRSTAIALAKAGFDLGICARTVEAGEVFCHSVRDQSGNHLSGCLNQTAEAARKHGAEVLVMRMDLLDPDSVIDCARVLIQRYGRIDLLINNAIYQGSDLNQSLLELESDTLQRVAQAYFVSPFLLVQSLLPSMLEQQQGCIINITSGAGHTDPPVAAADGGWGYAYAAGKAAVSRLSGVIAREHQGVGIKAFTVNPGVVSTETLKATLGDKAAQLSGHTASPESIADLLVWLATQTEAENYQYQTINAQQILAEHASAAEPG